MTITVTREKVKEVTREDVDRAIIPGREAACLPLYRIQESYSMSDRVCVFVDGENFRHSIVDLFTDFNQKDYLPENANWEELFDWFVDKVTDHGDRVRTYWYVVEHLDFFPYRFPRIDKQPDMLRNVLCRDNGIRDKLKFLNGDALETRMQELTKELSGKRNRMDRRFKWWTSVQNDIAAKHSAIEFRRAGAITYNLFDDSFGQEKAVDVKLATDLITLSDIFDVAVIVSGDQDYVPAVQVVKDRGKKVVNVAFQTRGGKLLPGGARRLNHLTDTSLQIPYADFGVHLNLQEVTAN